MSKNNLKYIEKNRKDLGSELQDAFQQIAGAESEKNFTVLLDQVKGLYVSWEKTLKDEDSRKIKSLDALLAQYVGSRKLEDLQKSITHFHRLWIAKLIKDESMNLDPAIQEAFASTLGKKSEADVIKLLKKANGHYNNWRKTLGDKSLSLSKLVKQLIIYVEDSQEDILTAAIKNFELYKQSVGYDEESKEFKSEVQLEREKDIELSKEAVNKIKQEAESEYNKQRALELDRQFQALYVHNEKLIKEFSDCVTGEINSLKLTRAEEIITAETAKRDDRLNQARFTFDGLKGVYETLFPNKFVAATARFAAAEKELSPTLAENCLRDLSTEIKDEQIRRAAAEQIEKDLKSQILRIKTAIGSSNFGRTPNVLNEIEDQVNALHQLPELAENKDLLALREEINNINHSISLGTSLKNISSINGGNSTELRDLLLVREKDINKIITDSAIRVRELASTFSESLTKITDRLASDFAAKKVSVVAEIAKLGDVLKDQTSTAEKISLKLEVELNEYTSPDNLPHLRLDQSNNLTKNRDDFNSWKQNNIINTSATLAQHENVVNGIGLDEKSSTVTPLQRVQVILGKTQALEGVKTSLNSVEETVKSNKIELGKQADKIERQQQEKRNQCFATISGIAKIILDSTNERIGKYGCFLTKTKTKKAAAKSLQTIIKKLSDAVTNGDETTIQKLTLEMRAVTKTGGEIYETGALFGFKKAASAVVYRGIFKPFGYTENDKKYVADVEKQLDNLNKAVNTLNSLKIGA